MDWTAVLKLARKRQWASELSLTKLIKLIMSLTSFTISGFAHAQQEDSRVLVHSVESTQLKVDTIQITGHIREDKISISISQLILDNVGYIMIAARIAERGLGEVKIPRSLINQLDLQSGAYFAQSREGNVVLKLEVRFGEGNDCFINDDGRGRLGIVFSEGQQVETYRITYPSCEPLIVSGVR